MTRRLDRASLAFWFPKIKAAGLPVPRTEWIRLSAEEYREVHDAVLAAQSGTEIIPNAITDFESCVRALVEGFGTPCFLRTGHGANKHDWSRSCYYDGSHLLWDHIYNLIEWSEIVDFIGLPWDVWVVRELIQTDPLFYAFAGQMPIAREFRIFANDGEITHWQPYWPEAAIQRPSTSDWRDTLRQMNERPDEWSELVDMAERASIAAGGHWSVDLLQDAYGGWWLTDMAPANRSYKYDPDKLALLDPPEAK